jgi:hypothetical protein
MPAGRTVLAMSPWLVEALFDSGEHNKTRTPGILENSREPPAFHEIPSKNEHD